MRHPFSLVLLLLLTLSRALWANAADVPAAALSVDPTQAHSIGRGIEYLLGSPNARFEEIAARPAGDWQRSTRAALSLGAQGEGVWVRFQLLNAGTQPLSRQLEIKWPMLDRVELRQYDPQSGQWSTPQVTGDSVPPSQRPLRHRYLLLPVELPPQQPTWIYLQVLSHEQLILPMQLTGPDLLEAEDHRVLPLIYMFIGGMLVMLLYNLSLFVFTRSRSYIYYVLYLVAALCYTLSLNGIGYLYLWGESSWLAPKAYGLFAGATFLLALIFGRVFLKIPRYGGWVLVVNSLLIGYWSVLLLGVLFYPPLVAWMLPELMPLLTTILAFSTIGYLWYLGNISARLFTIAWSLLTVATICHLLALVGALPLNAFTLSSQMLGVFVEFVLLSIALAERINRERAERIEAQRSLLASTRNLAHEREEKLRAQQQILDLQRAANEELEARVRERTLDLENATRELERANQELAALSITDPLTRLYNRRHFDSVISEEVERSRRIGSPLSLMMLDIDHFKRINDTYGHPFGDECLRQVATIIRQNAKRAGDLAARFGGEEFILVLPANDIEHASLVAESIRSGIEALVIEHAGHSVSVTISIGVACLVMDMQTGIEPLIGAADAALYRAKRNGRNQIATHAT